MPQRWQRVLWCDGFDPHVYWLDDPEPRITGKAWIYGAGPSMWDFTLLLPQQYASYDDVEWALLLPPDNVTRWLAVDMRRCQLEIEPAVAVPDLDPPVIESPRLP